MYQCNRLVHIENPPLKEREFCKRCSGLERNWISHPGEIFLRIGATYDVNIYIDDLLPDATTLSRKAVAKKLNNIHLVFRKTTRSGCHLSTGILEGNFSAHIH